MPSRILKAIVNLKMIAVLRYVRDLVRDLWGGRASLLNKRNAGDNAKRLLAMVWPERWVGTGVDPADAQSRNYMLLMAGVGLVNLVLMERGGDLMERLTSALYMRQSERVSSLLGRSLAMSATLAVFSTALSWATSRLEVLWRAQITRRLHSLYFDKMAYYHISKLKQTDRRTGKTSLMFPHPDQQLAGEVFQASKRVVNMVVTLTQSLPLLFWFTFKLWRSRGLSFAVLPHLYLFGAYEIVQRYLPKNFFVLNLKLVKARNDYNSAVSRLVANAEAVAAVGGSVVEEGARSCISFSTLA